MASMYDSIREHLKKVIDGSVTLTYEKMDSLIKLQYPNKKLPQSAYVHPEWWDNKSHTQSLSWDAAGWKVAKGGVKLGILITFERK